MILKSAIYEDPFKPQVRAMSEVVRGINASEYPSLLGYVATTPKPRAETPLWTDKGDPLLAHWQYGLGRAAVFASDAKSRWAASWVGWNGFDRLWTNIFRDLLPHGNESEAVARYEAADEELVVEYHLSNQAAEPANPARILS